MRTDRPPNNKKLLIRIYSLYETKPTGYVDVLVYTYMYIHITIYVYKFYKYILYSYKIILRTIGIHIQYVLYTSYLKV
jgi:hypothetical protein